MNSMFSYAGSLIGGAALAGGAALVNSYTKAKIKQYNRLLFHLHDKPYTRLYKLLVKHAPDAKWHHYHEINGAKHLVTSAILVVATKDWFPVKLRIQLRHNTINLYAKTKEQMNEWVNIVSSPFDDAKFNYSFDYTDYE